MKYIVHTVAAIRYAFDKMAPGGGLAFLSEWGSDAIEKIADEVVTLNDLRDQAYQTSKDKGFHDEPKSMGDYLALIHSEVSEALEDHRDGHAPNEVWHVDPGGTNENRPPKPCGIPSEMADIVIRVLDFCGAHGIDIEKAVREKMAFNATRPHKHGRKVI